MRGISTLERVARTFRELLLDVLDSSCIEFVVLVEDIRVAALDKRAFLREASNSFCSAVTFSFAPASARSEWLPADYESSSESNFLQSFDLPLTHDTDPSSL